MFIGVMYIIVIVIFVVTIDICMDVVMLFNVIEYQSDVIVIHVW